MKASTSAELDGYLSASRQSTVASDPMWYKALGIEVDKDGFNTACSKTEKDEIKALLAKAKKIVEAPVEVAAPKAAAKAPKMQKDPAVKATGVLTSRQQTALNRVAAYKMIEDDNMLKMPKEAATTIIMNKLGVSREYAQYWLRNAAK